VRILIDYRPALRDRTGVGEYIHQLTRAYTSLHEDHVTIFSSSWRNRLASETGRDLHVATVDRRVPVRVLNLLWHRAGWPPIERLAGQFDVVHAAHPLLIPSRQAARVVTVHDLFFLSHSGTGQAEIRRDYPALAWSHARRADAVVTSTAYGRQLVIEHLGVPPSHVHVCAPGAPSWRDLGHEPNRPRDGYILFLGTLELRKNVGALLDAYAAVLARAPSVPRLVLAGRATPDSDRWLARIKEPPLRGHVEHLGYVADRESTYAGARLLVVPSLDEGFCLPALEAMSAGIPVVATNRGSLPEVMGDTGSLVDPTDTTAFADALERAVTDDAWAERQARAGLVRAAEFTWPAAAGHLRAAYLDAVDRQRRRTARTAASTKNS
jgi:glycosyltransferase involved in cell wall biosynthesis